MNELLTAPSRHLHPPQLSSAARPVRRVGLLDRLALRAGLALLVWARRPSRPARVHRLERFRTSAEETMLSHHRDAAHQLKSPLRLF